MYTKYWILADAPRSLYITRTGIAVVGGPSAHFEISGLWDVFGVVQLPAIAGNTHEMVFPNTSYISTACYFFFNFGN